MTARASHLHALLWRALSPSLVPRPRAQAQQITELGASRFGAAFLWGARFSSDASAAAQGSSKPAAAPGVSGGKGDDGKSGKSEQADAGKPVRGGPVSWLSFLLLLVTGGGIVVYYDKEKKRHIEGRWGVKWMLIWQLQRLKFQSSMIYQRLKYTVTCLC